MNDLSQTMEDIQLRECYDFENYVHPAGATEDVIEIWMPIAYLWKEVAICSVSH